MPRLSAFTCFSCSLALLAWLAPAMPAWGQTPAAAAAAAHQADVLQHQNQERIQHDIESAMPLHPAPGGADTSPLMPPVDASMAGKGCHDIQRIVINGAPHLSDKVSEHIIHSFTGRCLGVSDIEQILAEITKNYIDRGYITTRAYLPSQDVSGGSMEVLVVEGRIEKILLDDGARDSIRPGTVFPEAGDLFNLRDFEQGIDQLNRLASNNAQLDIQPGSVPGASQVLIRNTPSQRYHASLSADNHGTDSTGRNQLALSFGTDRLLGLNEFMLFTHRQSQPNDEAHKASVSDSFSAIVPFGYTTVSFSASRSHYVTTVVTPGGFPLRFHGNSRSDSLRLERVLYRDRKTRLALAGALTSKDSKNYLADEFLAVSSRPLTVFDLDASVSTTVRGGVLSADLGYARGLKLGGALRDPADLPDFAPRAQFGKFKLGLSYMRPFRIGGLDALFSTQFNAQRAQDTLYGSEQILIGGIYSVRGFDRNTLSGDHGWISRNELSVRPTLSLGGAPLPLRLYVGIDAGRVSSRFPGLPEGRLVGMALGVTGSWKGISFDVFNARPLSQPDFFSRESPQTWIRISFAI
jgi:hemolysin activation/secretion protein